MLEIATLVILSLAEFGLKIPLLDLGAFAGILWTPPSPAWAKLRVTTIVTGVMAMLVTAASGYYCATARSYTAEGSFLAALGIVTSVLFLILGNVCNLNRKGPAANENEGKNANSTASADLPPSDRG